MEGSGIKQQHHHSHQQHQQQQNKINNNNRSISAINEFESDQVLKLGFWINNNNKTKTMKVTTTIYHLLSTQFLPNFKVRFL